MPTKLIPTPAVEAALDPQFDALAIILYRALSALESAQSNIEIAVNDGFGTWQQVAEVFEAQQCGLCLARQIRRKTERATKAAETGVRASGVDLDGKVEVVE